MGILSMCIVCQTVCILCTWFMAGNCEIYSSMAEMEDLLSDVRCTIHEDISLLRQLPEKEQLRLKVNMENMEAFSDIISTPSFTVRHPISAYRFLQNMSKMYDATVQTTLLRSGRTTTRRMFSKLTSIEDDIVSTRNAIVRIQHTYGLRAIDILVGNINGYQTSQNINDCFKFVVAAGRNAPNSLLSEEWVDACLNSSPLGAARVDSLREASEELENNEMFKEAAKICEALVKIEPHKRYHKENLAQLQIMVSQKAIVPGDTQKHPLIELQDRLCQGVDLKSTAERQSKHLVCRLVHDHPLLKLQPGRAELRSRDPHIVIYHNVLSKTEMDNIKRAASQEMTRSEVITRGEGTRNSSPYRICQTAFVDMARRPFTITRKIEALTGLNTGRFLNDDTQIANYGVGGHFFIHKDFYGPENMYLDERMATFMFYLSNVDSGGATVFLGAKETVFPEEGAAVFWYNTYQNGTVNRNTQHAACPVAVGNKWIGTYWIHMNKQEFTKPCNLKKDHNYWPF